MSPPCRTGRRRWSRMRARRRPPPTEKEQDGNEGTEDAMAHEKNHDYHVLPPSIWPFMGSLGAFTMLFGFVLWVSPQIDSASALSQPWLFLMGLALVLYVMFAWWSEVVHEANTGDHTPVVRIGLRYGFIMFIMSEVMFFVAWFWVFFKQRMYPMGPDSPLVDGVYPP